MKEEQLKRIFEEADAKWDGDNAWQGLQIIAKYITKGDIITGADHDVIWSVGTEEILEAGLTENDAKKLANLNWYMDEEGECLACFV